MSYSISKVPHPLNEPVLSYAPESLEKEEVLNLIRENNMFLIVKNFLCNE